MLWVWTLRCVWCAQEAERKRIETKAQVLVPADRKPRSRATREGERALPFSVASDRTRTLLTEDGSREVR